jgi:hypothetical protein
MAPDDSIDNGSNSGPSNTDVPGVSPEEEPNTSGTVFLTLVFLMMIFGMWTVLYLMLLNR